MSDPSFQDIVNGMVSSLQAANSQLTDFTATSIVLQILQAVAAQIDQVYFAVDTAENQANVSTATGTGLDGKGADYGDPRKQATAAQFYFQFIKNTASSSQVPIPAGTTITTIPSPNMAPVTFTTNADSYMPVGSTTANVLATCQTAGSVGNITPGTTLLIGSAVPGIDGVSLQTTSTGTLGTDTETDDAYRSRLLIGLASKAQGTQAWYQAQALSVNGVSSCKVIPLNRGNGTVDIFIVGPNNSLPTTSLIQTTQSQIDANRIITDDAKVFAPSNLTVNWSINVKMASGTDLNAAQSQIQTAVQNYINGLGIGAGSVGAVYGSQINKIALGVAGALNVVPLATPLSDISVAGTQLPQAGTITVTTTY